MYTLSTSEIQTYLQQLGVEEIQPPTLDYLVQLHQAHVRRFSWQTVDIFAGHPTSIDIQQSIALLLSGRSGYCFHLNGAFSTLLRSLGYQVFWHRAGVQPLGTEPRINSFHLGLTVHLDHEGISQPWIIDVGLGDMPYTPLPLIKGTYTQSPFQYAVTSSSIDPKGWRLEHDAYASIVGVDIDHQVVTDLKPFEDNHEFYSRSPQSPWFDVFLLRQRDQSTSHELRGCVLKTIDDTGVQYTEIVHKQEWLNVLHDIFGESFVPYTALEKDEFWHRVQQAHEVWKQTQSLSNHPHL